MVESFAYGSESERPDPYKARADAPKQRAIELYQHRLNRQKPPPVEDTRRRLKELQENPKGSNQFDHFCP